MLLVPVLNLGFGWPLREAIGTSLVVVTGTAIAASAGYLRRGLASVRLAMGLEVGALLGAIAASLAAPLVPVPVLARAFAVALVWAALLLWWRGREVSATGTEVLPASRSRRRLAFATTPIAGLASGWLGVGGGLFQVPILRLILGVDMKRAVATSTLTVGWTAAVAAVFYWRRGWVDIGSLPWLLAGTLAGGALAPVLVRRVPQRSLELAFSLVLVWAAVRMALS